MLLDTGCGENKDINVAYPIFLAQFIKQLRLLKEESNTIYKALFSKLSKVNAITKLNEAIKTSQELPTVESSTHLLKFSLLEIGKSTDIKLSTANGSGMNASITLNCIITVTNCPSIKPIPITFVLVENSSIGYHCLIGHGMLKRLHLCLSDDNTQYMQFDKIWIQIMKHGYLNKLEDLTELEIIDSINVIEPNSFMEEEDLNHKVNQHAENCYLIDQESQLKTTVTSKEAQENPKIVRYKDSKIAYSTSEIKNSEFWKNKYPELFDLKTNKEPKLQYKVELSEKPKEWSIKHYNVNPKDEKIIKEFIDKYVEKGVLEPHTGNEYLLTSACFVVHRINHKPRVVIDFRKVNNYIKFNSVPFNK